MEHTDTAGSVTDQGENIGEFDPGSGRTLAACITHASRARLTLRGLVSGERVSNA